MTVSIDVVVVSPPDAGQRVNPADWFEQPGPVELEIGSGKGGFLLRRAREHPEINLLGIEWANKYFRYAADRIARWGVRNVRLMRTDAQHFVINHLTPGCLSAIHVYHPDPWPKKRHHKRRLFNPTFVAAAVEALSPGGRLAVQSDHEEYFGLIAGLLAAHHELSPAPFDEPGFGADDGEVATNFEVKYAREARRFHRTAFRKRFPEPRGSPRA